MSCLKPIRIKKADGSFMSVPCGKCVGCLNKKAYDNTLLCKLESLEHKYCFFITLTYAPDHLPVARIHQNIQRVQLDEVDTGDFIDYLRIGDVVSESLEVEVTTPRVQNYYNTQFIDSIKNESNRDYV